MTYLFFFHQYSILCPFFLEKAEFDISVDDLPEVLLQQDKKVICKI
jgi:hypothetical protein